MNVFTLTGDDFRYNVGKALVNYDSDEPPAGNYILTYLAFSEIKHKGRRTLTSDWSVNSLIIVVYEIFFIIWKALIEVQI